MNTTATAAQERYYVPHASQYSVLLSVGMFLLALGFVLRLNAMAAGTVGMFLGAGVIVYVVVGWFGDVIRENVGGHYRGWEDRSFRWGMVTFILSEVMFFAAFFGALYYMRMISAPELASFDPQYTPYPGYTGEWPTSGPKGAPFTPMAAWGIPAINTVILLTSGATLTWAHWGLLEDKRRHLLLGLSVTIALGLLFLALQVHEYQAAYNELGLTLEAGAYGATFFMLTGFHGLHVTLGTIMLMVMLARAMRGHFNPDGHFAFSAAAWYWHFVDVVWLLLFLFVYWF